ncbi:unnamed protein product [Victoria cruziana]
MEEALAIKNTAGSVGLVDYEDDEKEDDDMLARHGDKLEVSTVCDDAIDSPTKRKLSVRINSKDEELDSSNVWQYAVMCGIDKFYMIFILNL